MKLLLDVMCGGLVAYLRMCGYDTVYAGDRGIEVDDELRRVAAAESRTLVTRDVALAAGVERSILLETREVEAQLKELSAAGISLELTDEPSRCGRCNGSLEPVGDDASTPACAPDPATTAVWRCLDCEQHFWRGSHWDRVAQTLERVRDASTTARG